MPRRRTHKEVLLEREVKDLKTRLEGREVVSDENPLPVKVIDPGQAEREIGGQRYPVIAGVLIVPSGTDVGKLPPGTIFRYPDEPPQKVKWTREHLERLCSDPNIEGFTWSEFEPQTNEIVTWNGISYRLVANVTNRVPSPIRAVYVQSRIDGQTTRRRGNDEVVVGAHGEVLGKRIGVGVIVPQ